MSTTHVLSSYESCFSNSGEIQMRLLQEIRDNTIKAVMWVWLALIFIYQRKKKPSDHSLKYLHSLKIQNLLQKEIWRTPESCWCSFGLHDDFNSLLSFLPPTTTSAACPLKHSQALLNEPEVTPFLHLWQGLPCWKLDDLEAACRCGESGSGVRQGKKLAVPARR